MAAKVPRPSPSASIEEWNAYAEARRRERDADDEQGVRRSFEAARAFHSALRDVHERDPRAAVRKARELALTDTKDEQLRKAINDIADNKAQQAEKQWDRLSRRLLARKGVDTRPTAVLGRELAREATLRKQVEGGQKAYRHNPIAQSTFRENRAKVGRAARSGLNIKQAARILGLDPKTVRKHWPRKGPGSTT